MRHFITAVSQNSWVRSAPIPRLRKLDQGTSFQRQFLCSKNGCIHKSESRCALQVIEDYLRHKRKENINVRRTMFAWGFEWLSPQTFSDKEPAIEWPELDALFTTDLFFSLLWLITTFIELYRLIRQCRIWRVRCVRPHKDLHMHA